MRDDITPIPPERLSCYAREILELLAGQPAAAEIVIGGGVALAHYLDYRETYDLDAWWMSGPIPAAVDLLADTVRQLAQRHGLAFASRSWGETMSFELLDGPRKVFSLQIASRDRYLDQTVEAAWPPVRLETLTDNIACEDPARRGTPGDAAAPGYNRVRAGAAGGRECPPLVSGRFLQGVATVKPPEHCVAEPEPDSGALDHSVYPELVHPPGELITPSDKADYLQRVCASFDFGIFPDRSDWLRFADWKVVFDACPLTNSPAYHAFRAWYGWDAVPRGTCGLEPVWRIQDRREGRRDPCEDFV